MKELLNTWPDKPKPDLKGNTLVEKMAFIEDSMPKIQEISQFVEKVYKNSDVSKTNSHSIDKIFAN